MRDLSRRSTSQRLIRTDEDARIIVDCEKELKRAFEFFNVRICLLFHAFVVPPPMRMSLSCLIIMAITLFVMLMLSTCLKGLLYITPANYYLETEPDL